MIAALEGTVIHRDLGWLLLDVHGVGYQVYTSTQFSASMGDNLRIYVSHQIREDSATLYGFTTLAERALFEMLIGVSGVGPKSALAIMGVSTADRISQALLLGDTSLFEAAPGIGKKVAAKIIVELKGKAGGIGSLLPSELSSTNSELIAALESLGYKRHEVLPLLVDVPTEMTGVEDQLRWALKQLARRS